MAHIYRLFSIHNNHSYVGCSKAIRKRFREHRCLLRKRKHTSPALQALWDTQGEESFNIEAIETVGDHKDEKRLREQYWLDYFAKKGQLLNLNPLAGSPMPGAQAKAAASRVANGYKPTAESNKKRSLAQKGIPKNHGDKISATKQKKKYSQVK